MARPFEMRNDVHDAVKLLRDEHLVWSSDLEQIRRPLADLLEAAIVDPRTEHQAAAIARLLADTESEW